MSDNPDDALSGWTEQIAALAEAAGAIFGFYSALVTQGFTEDQALKLTSEWFLFQLSSMSKGES